MCGEVVSFTCTRLARPGTGSDIANYFLICAGLPDETLASSLSRSHATIREIRKIREQPARGSASLLVDTFILIVAHKVTFLLLLLG